jgi:hypothetical protein
MLAPIASELVRRAAEDGARSALPDAPQRPAPLGHASERPAPAGPGAMRRGLAATLRRSADRLAPTA